MPDSRWKSSIVFGEMRHNNGLQPTSFVGGSTANPLYGLKLVTDSVARKAKWLITVAIVLEPVLDGDVEVGGLWFLLVLVLCLPALIYGAAVGTKWGIVLVGGLVLVATVYTWMTMSTSDPFNPLNGLIPFLGLLPTILIAAFGAAADQAYRFFRNPSTRGES
jgi:hypothetical protein